jgi:hypothetical protein
MVCDAKGFDVERATSHLETDYEFQSITNAITTWLNAEMKTKRLSGDVNAPFLDATDVSATATDTATATATATEVFAPTMGPHTVSSLFQDYSQEHR